MPQCPKCGTAQQSLSPDFCAVCGTPLLSPPQGQQPASALPGSAIPWESIESLGIVRAVLRTLHECLFSPFMFFTKVASPHNAAMSFVYALILGSAGSIIGFLWTSLFLSRFHSSIAWLDGFPDGASISAASLVLMPLLTSAKVLFAAVYFQTLLTLTGTKRQGIKSTFSIVCYAESAAVLNLIPLVGSVVSLLWSLFLLSAGFKAVHRMSTVTTLAIIFLPLLILGIIGILALALLAGAAAVINSLL